VASVEDPVGPPVPEFLQAPKEGSKRPSSIRRQDTGNVFPDDPPRPQARSQLEVDEGELASGIVESPAESCDAEGLAGGSSDQKVNCSGVESPRFVLGDVAIVRHSWEPMREHAARERVDLAEADGSPAERLPRN
jgi:hypothetical protein